MSISISFAFAGVLFANLSWILIAVTFSSGYIYARSKFAAELRRTSLRIERRVLDAMVFTGRPAGMKVDVLNTDTLGVRGTFEDMIPEDCSVAAGANISERTLPPRSQLTLSYSIIPGKRGPFTIPGMKVTRTDGFGLFTEEQVIDEPTTVNAHTKKDSFDAARKMAGREHLEFAGLSRNPAVVLRAQEFEGIREYTPGDRARDIHWKLYTKLGKLMTKTYKKEGTLQTMIFVDCGRSMRLKASKVAKVDHAIDLSMQLSNILLSSYHPAGAAVFDEINVLGKIAPALGRHQFERIVQTLRGVPGSFVAAGDAEVGGEPESSPKAPPAGHDLTKADPEEGAAFLSAIEKLSSNRRHHTLGLGLEGAIKEVAAIKKGQEQLVIVISDLMSSRDAVLAGARTCQRTGNKMLVIHAYDDWYKGDPLPSASTDFEGMYGRLAESLKLEAMFRVQGASYIRIGPADTAPLIVRAIRRRR